MKKITGIYKITSPSNKVYIGSSVNIHNRWCLYRNLKCKTQTRLLNSLKKYGSEKHTFEILECCDFKELYKKELEYGLQYNVLDRNTGLNCRLPKAGEAKTYMSKETKKKIGDANRGKSVGKSYGHYKSKLKKLSTSQVIEIRILLKEGKSTQKEIGNKYNVSRKIISNISKGISYKTIGIEIELSNRLPINMKLTKEDYIMIKKLYKEGKTQTEISKLFNVDQSNISNIINNKYSNYFKIK